MKLNKLTNLLALALTLTLAATGCKKNTTGITPLPNPNPGAIGGSPEDRAPNLKPEGEGDIGTHPLPPIDPNDKSKWDHNRTALAAHTVHFALDSHVVRSSEASHIEAVATYLKGNSGVALLVEGHCDERGTEEYNRALGERRALAIREELIKQGADSMKIVTQTFGKDRKIDHGNTEAAHARNRRGEFVVLTPK